MRFDELKENYFIDEQNEKRRSVRYNILNSFIVLNDDSVFEVVDISTGGFSVKVQTHDDFDKFPERAELEALICLPIGKYPIKFETKRRSPSNMTAGFAFRKILPRSREAISKSFDIITLAHGMQLMKLDKSGNKTWLHSNTGSDLIFHFKDGDLTSFTIFLQKDFVSWSSKNGLNTGKINFNFSPQDVSVDLLNKKLNSLVPDQGISVSKVKKFSRFINSNKSMQIKLKTWVLEKLK